MATPEQLLNVARGEIGYSRYNDPQTGTKYGRWYAEYTGETWYGANGVAYCAMFVTWCLHQVGMMPPGGPFAYVPYGIANARNAGALVPLADAKPGDIVCFDWDPDGEADHTGFVEANYVNDRLLVCIEGNTSSGTAGSQSNGGGVYRRTRDYSTVAAIIRPQYGNKHIEPLTILEVISQMKATHIVFECNNMICIADVLAGTWRGVPNPQTLKDTITVLNRAGAVVKEWKDLGAKSNKVDNPAAFGKRVM